MHLNVWCVVCISMLLYTYLYYSQIAPKCELRSVPTAALFFFVTHPCMVECCTGGYWTITHFNLLIADIPLTTHLHTPKKREL